MLISPFQDWLAEQETKRGPLFYLFEWLVIFTIALLFWTILIEELRRSAWNLAAAAAVSSLYASFVIYPRLFRLSACSKCHSPLAITRQEVGRRHVSDTERCVEILHGGEEWYGHFIDLYTRPYRVEIIKYRCRHCGHVWERLTEEPGGKYILVRTIDVKD